LTDDDLDLDLNLDLNLVVPSPCSPRWNVRANWTERGVAAVLSSPLKGEVG
jgi:hypothetical protein